MKKNDVKRKIALCLAAICLFTGCSSQGKESTDTKKIQTDNQNEQSENKTISDAELISSLQQKYGANNQNAKYDYTESITVEKDESIEIDIGFDMETTDWRYNLDNPDNPFYELYEDAELQYPLKINVSYKEDNNKIVIEPSGHDMGLLLCDSLADANNRDDSEWGNYGKYYMVRYADLETGEKLEKPVITIINVKGEIEEAPKIQFFIDENGLGGFKWDPVEGAEKYLIFSVEKREETDGGECGYLACDEVAVTDQTSWTTDDVFKRKSWLTKRERISSINLEFKSYSTSEDEEDAIETADWKHNIYYGVMALSADEKKNSMASNLYALDEIAPLLVESEARNTEGESMKPGSVGEMPTHGWVVMCDGRLEQKLLEYDFDSVEVKSDELTYKDPDTGKKKEMTAHYFYIDYNIKGTALKDTMSVFGFQDETLEADLKEIEERQKQLENKTGDVGMNITIGDNNPSSDRVNNQNVINQMKYTANSAFSEYLAIQMLNHQEQIDISAWEEHYDSDKIIDAFFEAEYQNPLILGISGINISNDGKILSVTYEDDKETYERKQKEIKNKLSEVKASILKDGMSDLEKEFAINQYLCDTITYDQEALENAKANNMKKVDPQYQDSFTVYGALLKEKCVCAGYAGAFQLLAEEAGLESIVVTGYLEGNLAHAWNKIMIDGEWQIVDVTNNDMQFYPNALLNLSNEAAANILVEDKKYVLDSALEKYYTDSTEQEYYYVNNKYFDLDQISDSIVAALQTEDKVNLRTEYTITDEQFETLMKKVQEGMKDEKLGAGYWLGVIRVEKK